MLIAILLAPGIMSSNIVRELTFDDLKELQRNTEMDTTNKPKITVHHQFSEPTFELYGDQLVVRILESNFNMVRTGHPVIPVHVSTFELPFGSVIQNISINHSTPETIKLFGSLSIGIHRYDLLTKIPQTPIDPISRISGIYPEAWVASHNGGGLSDGQHTTFFTLRIYPVRYEADDHALLYVQNVTVTIEYEEPTHPLLTDNHVYDLIMIAPEKFLSSLEPLVTHKNNVGIKTKLVSVSTIYDEMFWYGRDQQEQIKYFIKHAIEIWGISSVLLIGGLDGQTKQWTIPVRYSRVVPPIEQEYAEQSFISDLYYADIYDSTGKFSSWDSNEDDQFSVWNEEYREEMDLYPDVYLGRLPCRTIREVQIMVEKIITYETNKETTDWFFNYVIVAGDSYPDISGFNEGELIGERSIELMPGFNPLRVYSSLGDINRKTVNAAMNQGAGFAFFCGHGSPGSWSTHFPPDGTHWTTGYNLIDMIPLKNQEKLPITIVGGCHNGKFDVGLMNLINGIREYGLGGYFFKSPYRFYYNEWVPNCWAWWLTSKPNGGAIATIANTGLGTHGEDDKDFNGVADYLEVLDGWMELRFLELYGIGRQHDLGCNHAQTITEYLHVFQGNNEKMDTKMAQQWQLFGDPTLRIGGYYHTTTEIL
jgi:hypothetical protein